MANEPAEPTPDQPTDDSARAASQEPTEPNGDLPIIEDAGDADMTTGQSVVEDDSDSIDDSARKLDDSAAGAEADNAVPTDQIAAVTTIDETDDAGAYAQPGEREETADPDKKPAFNAARAAHHIVVELKRVEKEVRDLLENRDPKRKRKLGGTRRWQELEEDIINWHYAGRFEADVLAQLRELIVLRHSLFHRLRFMAGTRPTWNS